MTQHPAATSSRVDEDLRDRLEWLLAEGMPEIPRPDREEQLAAVAAAVAACAACPLRHDATQPVPGEGDPRARLMFVGEGPGEEEDRQGRPFAGPAGQLLTRMIEAMGLTRRQVFITNVVKHRPPDNRTPEAAEIDACRGFLRRQIGIVRPQVIVALGGTAAAALLRTDEGITRLRGRWAESDGVAVMPTYHPSYLLRGEPAEQQQRKREAWQDLKQVMARLGLTPPGAATST